MKGDTKQEEGNKKRGVRYNLKDMPLYIPLPRGIFLKASHSTPLPSFLCLPQRNNLLAVWAAQ